MSRAPRVRAAGAQGIRWGVGVAVGVVLALLGGVLQPAQAEPLDVGFRDHSYGAAVTSPTAEKPQSKLWHVDGRWWGVLWDPAANRYTIQGFNLATQATQAWTSTGVTVDQRPNSQSDVLWDGGAQKLYVLTHLKHTDTTTPDQGLRMQRFGYSGGTYQLELTHTVANGAVESASLDKDSTGRLWVTYTEHTRTKLGGKWVMVAHTTTGDSSWTAPFVLPVDDSAVLTSVDDLSTVVAYGDSGGRRIGIMWSNQKTASVYFASHADGAPADAWSLNVVCSAALCPDDHVNIKSVDADPSGHLYAVIKTSLNDKSPTVPDDPLIVVYRLNPSGSWSSSTAWTVGEGDMTRPIVVLDSQNRRVHAFAAPCCNGGPIYTKNASFDTLDFPRGNGTVFIRSAVSSEKINNPTSTKQTVNGGTGLLVIASMDSTRQYVHNYLPLGGGTPPPPPPPPEDTDPPTVVSHTPGSGATGVPVSCAVTATFSEPVDAATVSASTVSLTDAAGASVAGSVTYDDATRTVTLEPAADLAHAGEYTARIVGGASGVRDVAGNALAADEVWSFTTVDEPPAEGDTVLVPVAADTWVSSAAPETNFGSSSVLGVDGSPQDTAYLRFDLGSYAGRSLQAAELRLRNTRSGSAGTQAVRLVADDGWAEGQMTYATRPSMSAAELGRLGPTDRDTDYAVPLDAAALAGEVGGILTLGMDSTHPDGAEFGSRETSTPAVLRLTFGDVGEPPPPDTTAPTVVGTSPADGASGTAPGVTVSATFSEPMDPATVTASSMRLTDAAGATVAATVSYRDTERRAVLDPTAELAPDSEYTVRVVGGAAGVADQAGNRLAADHVWTFRTAPPSEDPVSVSVPVAEDGYVSASAPTRNYGSRAILNVDASKPVAVGYLKFDLSSHAGRTLRSAELWVRVTSSGSGGTQTVRLGAHSTWSEGGLTYDNRPALASEVLGRLGPTERNTTYTVPLDATVLQQGLGGAMTLGLDTTHPDGVDLGSREAGWAASLELVFE